jgi:hypothetical protein
VLGCGFESGQGDGFLRAIKIRSTPSFRWEVRSEVPCRKILRHVKDPLKYHGDEQTQFSFLSPISYCSRDVSGDGQSALVVKLGVSPRRSRLLAGSHRYHPGIVQNAQGRSAETAVSPHHNNQSTIYYNADSAYHRCGSRKIPLIMYRFKNKIFCLINITLLSPCASIGVLWDCFTFYLVRRSTHCHTCQR